MDRLILELRLTPAEVGWLCACPRLLVCVCVHAHSALQFVSQQHEPNHVLPPPLQAYARLSSIVTHCNMVMSAFQSEQFMSDADAVLAHEDAKEAVAAAGGGRCVGVLVTLMTDGMGTPRRPWLLRGGAGALRCLWPSQPRLAGLAGWLWCDVANCCKQSCFVSHALCGCKVSHGCCWRAGLFGSGGVWQGGGSPWQQCSRVRRIPREGGVARRGMSHAVVVHVPPALQIRQRPRLLIGASTPNASRRPSS